MPAQLGVTQKFMKYKCTSTKMIDECITLGLLSNGCFYFASKLCFSRQVIVFAYVCVCYLCCPVGWSRDGKIGPTNGAWQDDDDDDDQITWQAY